MATDNENIRGGRELDAFLQTLSAKVEKNIMRSALRQGANVFRDDVRANIDAQGLRDSGDLRRSVKVSTNSKGGTVTSSLRVGNKKAFYAHMLEFGVQAHSTKKGASVRSGRNPSANPHPGFAAKPFMRPTLDTKVPAAILAVTAQIRKKLTLAGINTPDPEPVE
jgi:HK97 gp10 family phage protein